PTARIALELLIDASPSRVKEVHQGRSDRVGELLHAHDFFECALPPGARLDGVVVGDDTHRARVDLADTRHHCIAWQSFVVAREESVLEAPTVVEQQLKAITHE